jgi:hypothetical protein
MHPKERGVQKQVVQRDLVESAARPRLILGADRLADFGDRRLGDRGLIAERFGQGGLDIPTDRPRTNAAITSVSRALVFVTCLPNNRDANAAVVPRSFGRSNVTGPVVVLTVTGRYPLREPSLASGQTAVRW